MGENTLYLLEKFLDGHCTPDEQREVNGILDTGKGRTLLDELIRQRQAAEWENPGAESAELQKKIRQNMQEMHHRISRYEKASDPARGKAGFLQRRLFRHAAVWAGIILVSCVAIWQLSNRSGQSDLIQYVEHHNPQGPPRLFELPDGTRVYLAGGSHLKYPDSYPAGGRDIELYGEAFFDVKRDEKHPFSIRTGPMLTRVLGTSFKVTAYQGREQEVAVATGKVSVSRIIENEVTELAMLVPGRKMVYDPQTGKAEQGNTDINSIEQWKTGELVFADMEMADVALALENRFGVTLRFAGQDKAKNVVSGSFAAAEPLTGILDMLGLVGKFSYEISADKKVIVIR